MVAETALKPGENSDMGSNAHSKDSDGQSMILCSECNDWRVPLCSASLLHHSSE